LERVVMAEAGGEAYIGQIAVAQCILNVCERDDIRPGQAVVKYRYTKRRPAPSESVKRAVAAVFDDGEIVTEEPILFFYSPALCKSPWHESQIFVMEIGCHRFFAERGREDT
jgi:spore germination cell wall hydrolase CwlJ-like protein